MNYPNAEEAINKALEHGRNDEIREAFRRIYCMSCTDFIDLMGFADAQYTMEKWRKVQDNPARALVDDLDQQHSDLLLNWALRK